MSLVNWALTGVIVMFFFVGLDSGLDQRPEMVGFLLICFVALFFGMGLGFVIHYLASL